LKEPEKRTMAVVLFHIHLEAASYYSNVEAIIY
jgi:hypothetical protein